MINEHNEDKQPIELTEEQLMQNIQATYLELEEVAHAMDFMTSCARQMATQAGPIVNNFNKGRFLNNLRNIEADMKALQAKLDAKNQPTEGEGNGQRTEH